MSAETLEKLHYMVNHLARNLRLEREPVAAIVEHITAYWTPAMRASFVEGSGEGLSDLAQQVREALGAQASASDDQ